jgi:hypothetical protein
LSTLEKSSYFSQTGRSLGTSRPLLKNREVAWNNLIISKKNCIFHWQGGSLFKWLTYWFQYLSMKVIYEFNIFKVFKIFEISKKKISCLLFFINLLSKAKRKWNFSMSLHRKYYKAGATIITQFFILFLFNYYYY